MSSLALVIKDANFSANALTQVVIGEGIPCTGIELDKSTISVNSLDGTQSITPTISPTGCTDTVSWSTSDSNVATVSNGVVSFVGLGTATITATCGEYSATCSVTVDDVVISSGFTFALVTNNNGQDYAQYQIDYARLAYVDRVETTSERYRLGNGSSHYDSFNLAPHVFPKGTNSINIKATSGLSNSYTCYIFFFDSQTLSTAQYLAKMLDKRNVNGSSNKIDITFNVSEGADSFVVFLRASTTYDSSTNPDTVASTIGYTITYSKETAS